MLGDTNMVKDLSIKSIREPAEKIKVCYEADVVVAGGGPGGHSAAMAAACRGSVILSPKG